MSELSYKELQEQGVFDVPYRAFEYMQSQQAKIDELKMSNHHLSVQLVDSNAHYDHVKKERDELQAKIDDLTELNRLRTIALEQSVNRTSIHVHEKIIALENKLKGNKDEN